MALCSICDPSLYFCCTCVYIMSLLVGFNFSPLLFLVISFVCNWYMLSWFMRLLPFDMPILAVKCFQPNTIILSSVHHCVQSWNPFLWGVYIISPSVCSQQNKEILSLILCRRMMAHSGQRGAFQLIPPSQPQAWECNTVGSYNCKVWAETVGRWDDKTVSGHASKTLSQAVISPNCNDHVLREQRKISDIMVLWRQSRDTRSLVCAGVCVFWMQTSHIYSAPGRDLQLL